MKRSLVVHIASPALLLVSVLATAACGGDDAGGGEPTFQNQLFTGTGRIDAAQDGAPAEPGFSWVATGWRHVVCAVFAAPIAVRENEIVNTEALAWIWHSGLGTGREGNLRYSDGRAHLAASGPPPPLEPGTYYWAVWAMNDAGHVVASSIEYRLQVP